MKNNGKPLRKITLSIFSVVMMITLLSAGASAECICTKTPLGDGTPPATQELTCDCGNRIGYTAVAASGTDPTLVQFKDLSKGKESYIGWEFGDGVHVSGTKNPVHKYKKTGYYITELTIRCRNCGRMMWVHNNVVIK